jgi:hypothetical protein
VNAIKHIILTLLLLISTANADLGWRAVTNPDGTVTIRRTYLSEVGGNNGNNNSGGSLKKNDNRIVIYGKEYYHYVNINGKRYNCGDREAIVSALIALRVKHKKGDITTFIKPVSETSYQKLKEKKQQNTFVNRVRQGPKKLKP